MADIVCPYCNEHLEIYEERDSYICPECGEAFQQEDIRNNQNKIGCFGLIIIILIGYFLFKWISGPKWTLLLCEDLLRPGYRYECGDIEYSFKDSYKSLDECRVAGESYLNSYPGYECGYKCEYDTSWMAWVCKSINE